MTRETDRRSVLGALAGAGALSVAGVTGQAAAQSTETQPDDEPTEQQRADVVAELGATLTITDWDWQSEQSRFRVDLTSKTPNRIKLTDTGALMKSMTQGDGSGAFEIPSEGRTLSSGETRLFFPGVTFEDVAAVTVASPDGAVLLRTDSIELSRPAVEYGTAGLMAGGAAIGSGWLSFKRTKEKMEESDEPEAERIA